jgi:hypothetical protein
MTRKHDRSYAKAETDVAAALGEAGGDSGAAAEAVAYVTSRDLRDSERTGAALLSVVSALADAVARGTAAAGADAAVSGQGFMTGVLRGALKRESRVMVLIEHASVSFVKHALGAGLDPGKAAKGLVEGAAAWSRARGFGSGLATAMAEQGAIDAADDVSPGTGRKVRAALMERHPGEPFTSREPAGSTGEC